MIDWLPARVWALLAGLLLDLAVGDPEWFPHPTRGMGIFIRWMEGVLRERFRSLRAAAPILTASTVLASMIAAGLLLELAGLLGEIPRFVMMVLLSWTCVSVRNMADEAKGVARALAESLDAGRRRVSRIVGRDTDSLTHEEVIKAAVESVAESTTDGVIAPLLWLALGGPVAGIGFKAASTLDSMVGYMDDKYRDIGWSSARLDDLLNWIPARLTAALMLAAAWLTGLDARNARRIVKRDHANHKSPNCAWSEAAAAGALRVQLGGTHLYFGKPVVKPTIGDDDRNPVVADIRRTCRLLYGSAALMAVLIAAVWGAF
ncbi:MAG: adenosylcobinamide-phosphate synthase CbiB [Oscillospiraceae bacterium]|nr:adenosylcobinamide-phosphate synthase CbiB [Oscillospiraceae bacterium]